MFLPPDRGKNWGGKKILSKSQSTCPYASNKPSPIIIGQFSNSHRLVMYLCTMRRAHCTGVQCVFIKSLNIYKDLNKITLHARAMCTHIKKADCTLKNGPNLMYDGLLEAYGQVV